MSSSIKDFKIKAFRSSKDVESVNPIQEQETPTPSEKKKISTKAKKLASRLVPAALGKSSLPDCWYLHKVIWLVLGAVIGVLKVLHANHHGMDKQVDDAMHTRIVVL